jgi:hypothetical protein
MPDTPKPPTEALETIGSSITAQPSPWGTMIDEEWDWRLRGRRGQRTYEEMRDVSATVGASMFLFRSLAKQIPLTVEPMNTPRGQEAADLFSSMLEDMSHTVPALVGNVMSMLPFGWALFEKVYKTREGLDQRDSRRRSRFNDGYIGIRKIDLRPQKTLDGWGIAQDGSLLGMWQRRPHDLRRVFLPIGKCLLFRTSDEGGNPEGRSILRNAYRSWFMLKRLEELEAAGAERELVGVPYATVPLRYMSSAATPAEKSVVTTIERALKNLARNEQPALMMPAKEQDGMKTGFDFGLMTTGGRRAVDLGPAISRHNHDIAISILTQFIFLGMEKVGTEALAGELTSILGMVMGSIVDEMIAVLNRYLVDDIMLLNGFGPLDLPLLSRGEIDSQSLEAFTGNMLRLVDAGLIEVDTMLQDHVRQKFRLPEADPDDDFDPDDDPRNRRRRPEPDPDDVDPLDPDE